MAESNEFVGVVSASDLNYRTTYASLTSTQAITAGYTWAAFTMTPFLKAIGVEAMGVPAMANSTNFGQAMAGSIRGGQNGRLIRYDEGIRAVQGTVFATTGTTNFAGRLTNFTPELVEGGDAWIYSWHRIFGARFIPDVDVQDNGADRYIDIKLQKMDELKQSVVRDFSLSVLGSSSAPQTGVMGPDSVYSDLPNLISVTQARTVGGIATTNSFWQNETKAIADLGGGGDYDRPLLLRRGMKNGMHDVKKKAEAQDGTYLLLATQGAFEFYDRLFYADALTSGANPVFGFSQRYDAAGIEHFMFNKYPMVWDPNCTIPYGATASTNAIYGIHLPTFAISFRREEAFLQTPWEEPRTHDTQRTLMCQNRTRFTPMVTGRRAHIVFYNLPVNSD